MNLVAAETDIGRDRPRKSQRVLLRAHSQDPVAVDTAADDLNPEFHGVRHDNDNFPPGAPRCDRFSECFKQISVSLRELAPIYDGAAQRCASGNYDDVAAHLLWSAGDFDRRRDLVKGIEKVRALSQELSLTSFMAVAHELKPIGGAKDASSQKVNSQSAPDFSCSPDD
jgi:hypothetical protein